MKKYVFKPYNESYPKLYQDEEQKLKNVLGNDILIEHIGSTAIPGLGGKGIIDIMIAAPKYQMKKFSELVQQIGYEYKASGGNEERIFHQRDENNTNGDLIRYHLHITFPESSAWREDIAFRDHLRNNPEDAILYAEIKLKAARKSDQTKEKYMEIKEPVIQEILQKALQVKNFRSSNLQSKLMFFEFHF